MTSDKETKWDHSRFERKTYISNDEKIAISDYYRTALKTGRSSSELLEELSAKYNKSERQVQRYIKEVEKNKSLADRLLQMEQMRHIADLQSVVRSFLRSIPGNIDYNDIDQCDNARYLLWQSFKELTGNALWDSLHEHLGTYGDLLLDMTFDLEPDEIKKRKPGEVQVFITSTEEEAEIIQKAIDLISHGYLDTIVESADAKVWALNELQPICQWCPIQKLRGYI